MGRCGVSGLRGSKVEGIEVCEVFRVTGFGSKVADFRGSEARLLGCLSLTALRQARLSSLYHAR